MNEHVHVLLNEHFTLDIHCTLLPQDNAEQNHREQNHL